MSILNGAISGSIIHKTPMPYGEELRQAFHIPQSGCADVAINPEGTLAYAACHGELIIYALQRNAAPRELGRAGGLGASRQVSVDAGFAYVTARADGLYIVDVRNPAQPRLAVHLDTLELATGVCAAHGLCLVTNRHMGVEIWDVAQPEHPQYLACFLAGEAQSVCIDGAFAYAGDWMNRRVHVVSIADPRHPVPVSDFSVDGFADGVFVRDGLCLVASGHHSAKLKNRRKYHNYTYLSREMLEDGYGCGHGLTLFDVSRPDAPEYLSEIKFPPLFAGANDTWRVVASGDYAYVADTYNGVFVVNIADRLAPTFAGYRQLPLLEKQPVSPPSLQPLREPAVGIACGHGQVLVAGLNSGLHVLDFTSAQPIAPCAAPERPVPAASAKRVFRCAGQVHSLLLHGKHLLLACGDDGMYALENRAGYPVAFHVPCFAHDIAEIHGILCVAQGDQGVAAYRFSDAEGFAAMSTCATNGLCARQIVPIPERNLIAVQLNVTQIGFLRVSATGSLSIETILPCPGMLYHRHLCLSLHSSGRLAAMPLSNGLCWYNLDTLQPEPADWLPPEEACPFEDGVAICGNEVFIVRGRRYGVLEEPCRTATQALPENLRPVPGAQLRGIPYVLENTLVLLNRVTGLVERLDIRDAYKPVLLDAVVLPAHPEFAVSVDGACWVACGHDGLFLLNEKSRSGFQES